MEELFMFSQQGSELCEICSHHFCHLCAVLEKFERGHGLDFLVGSDIFGFVNIDFGKDDLLVFRQLGKLFEFRANESAGSACIRAQRIRNTYEIRLIRHRQYRI